MTVARPSALWGIIRSMVRATCLCACLLFLLGTAVPAHAVQPAAPPRSVPATSFQLIYLYPRDRAPVAGRVSGLRQVAGVVDGWVTEQLNGLSPRFVTDASGLPSVISLRSTLPARALNRREDVVYDVIRNWRARGILAPGVLPIVFIEGLQQYDACAWSWDGVRGPYISLPMASCDAYPSAAPTWPDMSTYLLAHEMVHALGAVDARAPHEDGTSHIAGDPQDLMFGGDWDEVDWAHLAIDPGNDDYYRTGRADLVNIEDSLLLE